ncbi:ADP-ribose pyrophosphatase [Natronomonas pharaonis DSM 2160]|uniref:ADP-ribose pyrophosphatase n=1 Tax=Natronomonas pharaonis (strain ATCC 35678 / DSM 2160 / CIP 103997 / JCM 8858 / NBRC 14720 / NCIMB 2260 / Gabara) TaxID=348780 RepID=A0A1U7EY50_NATPD|nr:molybdopterin-binding protein [Natronomonas pharaonis]CAI50141.1 ADP-ribose pyrophosphatase [Natronomonas pharaonis DSM 2160]
MNVALVSVGDELLSGDTVNTNAAWLGERLTERGASVARVTVVPDRVADIARVVNEHAADYDAVIVTGGIGPTHDDKTMEGVAAAVGRSLSRNEAALEWLESAGGYAREDLTEGTTLLPADAEPLHNTEGVAPGCKVENVYVLPGVPAEMKAMFESVADDFDGEPPHVGYVAVNEPESQLVDRLQELQERFAVTVGSYPGEHVRVKIESTDAAAVNAAMAWLQDRAEVEESD